MGLKKAIDDDFVIVREQKMGHGLVFFLQKSCEIASFHDARLL
jgi:hypothetical protein